MAQLQVVGRIATPLEKGQNPSAHMRHRRTPPRPTWMSSLHAVHTANSSRENPVVGFPSNLESPFTKDSKLRVCIPGAGNPPKGGGGGATKRSLGAASPWRCIAHEEGAV